MGRTVKMEYPHGWVEDYHYDSIGQLLKVEDTDPSGKDMKQQKHVYKYDDCGNMTYEYMRGNGTGEATVENFYTYDALHRVTNAKENYGNASRTYQYDSLGNLTWETNSNNVTTDYKLNNLNQITEKSSNGWKTHTTFTYEKRGNLIQEQYGKNKKVTSIGTYTYDETNKMVKGVNANAESSSYLYNGLGALVEQTWVIAKNSYGYHDVLAEAVEPVAEEPETAADTVDSPEIPAPSDDNTTETDAALDEAPADSADSGIMLLAAPKKDDSGKKPSDKPTGSEVKKTSTVVKEFVVDYTTETHEPLMEHEVNGLDYRYVYGNDRLSVNITGVETGSSKLMENGNQIRLYYHMDYLGTADYLTSPLTGKVESWTHYNEWGEITHNAVLKCGQRELDLVKRYATHDFDAVLNQYYAKARFYDAENRHFTAMDPILDPSQYSIKEYVDEPVQLVQYLYVKNNAINWIDPLGLYFIYKETDDDGETYYRFVRQNKADTFLQGFSGASIQQILGTAVAGSSLLSANDILTTQFKTIYQAEIEQFKMSLANAGPYGAAAAFVWEASEKFITFFVDIPNALNTSDRDRAIESILNDAGISKTSYSSKFIPALDELDEFVKSNVWIFTEYKSLGRRTPYDVGKAIATGDQKNIDKARKAYASYFRPAIEATVLAEVGKLNEYFWLDYYHRNGCFPIMEYSRTYKPMFPSKNNSILGTHYLPEIKTTRQEADERLDALIKEQFNLLESLYNDLNSATIELFS